jgi:hypothetical protein
VSAWLGDQLHKAGVPWARNTCSRAPPPALPRRRLAPPPEPRPCLPGRARALRYTLKPKPGVPGAVDPKPDDWMSTRWMVASKEVFKAASGGKPILAGPEWSTLGMKPDLLKWWLTQMAPFLNMVTIHHYGEPPEPGCTGSAGSLLQSRRSRSGGPHAAAAAGGASSVASLTV